MASSDYRLCDVCERKTFYDACLNYEFHEDTKDPTYSLEHLGAWRVLCSDCSKTHLVVVLSKEKPEHAVIVDRLLELGDIVPKSSS